MKRREFITLLGGAAAAWPLAARAQQPAMPVIGILSTAPALVGEKRMSAFRQGLGEIGFTEGLNVATAMLGADGRLDRLPALAAELVRRRVSVVVCPQSSAAVRAVRDATTTIPIIFSSTLDPVALGLVASLARPGGNATGVNNFSTGLAGKRLGLLRELLPAGKVVAVLFNPAIAENEAAVTEIRAASDALGQQVRVVNAGTISEIDLAFAMLARERPDALLIVNDPLFSSRNMQIVLLATRHAIPAIYTQREFAEIGGLMSYGTSLAEVYHQMGVYTGRVLKGAKPAELPIVQSTKFEMVINLQSAKAIGLDVPPTLLAAADEVIE
jgi:putative tryptophan/tyrosine transport system substrate-binding protein